MKRLAILILVFCCRALAGQTLSYTPPAYAAYLGNGSTWSAWTSAAAFGSLSFTPPAIGLYCQVSANAKWTPCVPTGGTGSGTVTSVGLTTPSWLTVTGSPVTTTGTLAIAPTAAQASHQVIGTCGTATTFTPCALSAADVTGLGTAAAQSIGTSGATVPLLSTANTWTTGQTFGGNMLVTGAIFMNSGVVQGAVNSGGAVQYFSNTNGIGMVMTNLGTQAATTGNTGIIDLGNGVNQFTPPSGSANFAALAIDPVINGVSTGTAYGLLVAPVTNVLTGGTVKLASFGTSTGAKYAGYSEKAFVGLTGDTHALSYQSTATTGTAPFTVASATPVANLVVSNHPTLQYCGLAATCSPAASTNGQIVYGSAVLVAGSVTITGISPAFADTAYVCTVTSKQPTAATVFSVTNVSTTSFTVNGTTASTDTVGYICVR